jgi:hypothetical protein
VPDEKAEVGVSESKPPCGLPRHPRGPALRSQNHMELAPRPRPDAAKTAHMARSA